MFGYWTMLFCINYTCIFTTLNIERNLDVFYLVLINLLKVCNYQEMAHAESPIILVLFAPHVRFHSFK